MEIKSSKSAKNGAVITLRRGGVGIFLTDTIYGIVGSALKPATVARIYRLRKRNRNKPFIVLIASLRDLTRFGVRPDAKTSRILRKLWPGPVSVILPCSFEKLKYLHRGTDAIAFRVPAAARLRALLRETGPLVAPSANPEGKPPAVNISEARAYFKNRVDFYTDAGKRKAKPSTLIRITHGAIEIIRTGALKIKQSPLTK